MPDIDFFTLNQMGIGLTDVTLGRSLSFIHFILLAVKLLCRVLIMNENGLVKNFTNWDNSGKP